MYALSAEQQHTLVCIVSEERGKQLPFEQFADAILDLFENVPGFETIPAGVSGILCVRRLDIVSERVW